MPNHAQCELEKLGAVATIMRARRCGDGVVQQVEGTVGPDGFCFEAAAHIEPGTEVEIYFLVPGVGLWIQVLGVVQHCIYTARRVVVSGRIREISPSGESYSIS